MSKLNKVSVKPTHVQVLFKKVRRLNLNSILQYRVSIIDKLKLFTHSDSIMKGKIEKVKKKY
jgi:hypothetical protein